MLYYGKTSESHIYFLAYGAPVKALVHSDVRDSKYDDHAITGIYRGPSWTNNSSTSCWISVGKGTVIRHVTCDIGCVRVDERQVVARISRTHPCHQPKAISTDAPVADIDLRNWVHPALQSRNSSFVWTAASAAPTRPFMIYYGGGDASDEGLAGALRRLPDVNILAPMVVIIEYITGWL